MHFTDTVTIDVIGHHRHAIDRQASYTAYNPTALTLTVQSFRKRRAGLSATTGLSCPNIANCWRLGCATVYCSLSDLWSLDRAYASKSFAAGHALGELPRSPNQLGMIFMAITFYVEFFSKHAFSAVSAPTLSETLPHNIVSSAIENVSPKFSYVPCKRN